MDNTTNGSRNRTKSCCAGMKRHVEERSVGLLLLFYKRAGCRGESAVVIKERKAMTIWVVFTLDIEIAYTTLLKRVELVEEKEKVKLRVRLCCVMCLEPCNSHR